jgi:CRISPR-associated endonuclease Csy4
VVFLVVKRKRNRGREMKYYLDITILPDVEANLGFLWQKVYQQVHLALVDNSFESDEFFKNNKGHQEKLKKSKIAISFPKYGDKDFPLGNTLRLLAETKEQLQSLKTEEKLNRLMDYSHCKSIKRIDKENVIKYVCFKRKQFKSPTRISADIERRASYLAKKNNRDVTEVKAELLERSKKYKNQSKLPFINLISLSSKPNVPSSEKDRFLLFIEMKDMDTELKGNFTCYGLSSREANKTATVPWF